MKPEFGPRPEEHGRRGVRSTPQGAPGLSSGPKLSAGRTSSGDESFFIDISPRSVQLRARQGTATHPRQSSGSRSHIDSFSYKSRLALRKAVAQIDLEPLFQLVDEGWFVVMLTFTLPGDWLPYAPTPSDAWALVAAYRSRQRRATGRVPLMVVKKEFQVRGAPHFHILTVLPPRLSIRGIEYSMFEWVSRVWFEIVGSGEPAHLAAGTGVDVLHGDPLRVINYFAGYINGRKAAAKERQHHAPAEWGGRAGRFWSITGFERVSTSIPISKEQFFALRRLLRAHARTRRGYVRVRVERRCARTGRTRWRWATRPRSLGALESSALRGCLRFVSDGPNFLDRLEAFFGDLRGMGPDEQLLHRGAAADRKKEGK